MVNPFRSDRYETPGTLAIMAIYLGFFFVGLAVGLSLPGHPLGDRLGGRVDAHGQPAEPAAA